MLNQRTSAIVIESQPLMRSALSSMLTAEGLTVLAEVSEGSAIFQKLKTLHPDLVLIAIGHPGYEDLEAIKILRQLLPTAYLVALTSGEVPGQEQMALQYGAHKVADKTAPRASLLSILQSI